MNKKIELYLEKFSEIAEQHFNDSVVNKYDTYFNQKFFKEGYIENLDWDKLKELGSNLHSLNALRLAHAKAVNADNNKIEILKNAFLYLTKPVETDNIYSEIEERLKNVLSSKGKYKIKYWGISSISEIISQRFPNELVFYNHRDKEALKFLEIKIKGRNIWNRYIEYQKTIKPIIEKYKEIVLPVYKPKYPIGIQIDQFFSWIYENYVEQGYSKSSTEDLQPILYNHLSKIKIENYFSIKNIELKNLSKEIYILGENGVGKTILLQAILLSTKLNSIKSATNKRYTGVVLENTEKNSDFKFSTIDNESNEFSSDNNLYLKNIFAYGVNRNYTIKGKNDYEYLTLFSNEYSLINPVDWLIELHNRELEEKSTNKTESHISLEQAKEMVIDFLEKNISINVSYNNVIFTEIETELTFEQLSDGYRSVMTWVIDMIARLSKNQPNIDTIRDFQGVLLIDELDLFLHPQWSYKIVSKLRHWFPKIQFIISTHSPILTLGASKDAKFYKMYKEDGISKIIFVENGNKNMTANSLITSLLWRLETFTTHNIEPEFISSDDDIYSKIHKTISKRIKNSPLLTDEDVLKQIEIELNKIKIK